MGTRTIMSATAAVVIAASPALAQDVQSVATPEAIVPPVPIVGAPADAPAVQNRALENKASADKPAAKKKPKAGKAIGETVGGVLGGVAASTTGPVGGALGGFVGKKLGGGLGGALHRLFGTKTAKSTQSAAREPAPIPRTAEQPTPGPASFEAPPPVHALPPDDE